MCSINIRMERKVDELFVGIFEEGCSLAVSQANSHVYITNEWGAQVFSRTGEHVLDFSRLGNQIICLGSGISIFENFVIVTTLDASAGFLQIFTLDGFLITMLNEFKINGKVNKIKDPMGVLLDKADHELALFLCDPRSDAVYCSTPFQNYFVCNGRLVKPRDVKSSTYELFIALQPGYHRIVMVDKFDIGVTLSLISLGLGSCLTSPSCEQWYDLKEQLYFFCIHPIREELYVSKCSNGLLEVYSWDGLLVEVVESELLVANNCFLQQGMSTDEEGNVFVLIDSKVIRIDMRSQFH